MITCALFSSLTVHDLAAEDNYLLNLYTMALTEVQSLISIDM
jgi:hypothetical protein